MFNRLNEFGLQELAYGAYIKSLQQIPSVHHAENIYESDWEVLIILDACRPDLFEEVCTNYDFFNASEFETRHSVASMTREWMNKTFTDEYADDILETAYICGNPFSDNLSSDQFGDLEEVWKYGWDDKLGTVPPDVVTNRSIHYARSNEWNRLLIHYLQPHVPFRNDSSREHTKDPKIFGESNKDRDIWDRIRAGDEDPKRAWEWYQDNLIWVLDEVSELLENIDAENVVLTSDHANAVGEWRLWGHPAQIPFSAVREVPWLETTANDKGTRKPNIDRHKPTDVDVEDRLESLGYRS